MPAQHLNFKQIRERADFTKVLTDYGIELQKDGSKEGQFKALCPFHDDHSPSMKVNITKNIFHCFACEAGGNVLEFVVKMDGSDLRSAARKIADLSGIAPDTKSTRQDQNKPNGHGLNKKGDSPVLRAEQKLNTKKEDRPAKKQNDEAIAENPPLTFELKNLEMEHPFFEERGLTTEMVDIFGLGIATRGIMKGRLVFPIHNASGDLIAYCGRYVEKKRPKKEPKYKHPAKFRKELEWFNWHRAIKRLSNSNHPIILVESFLSAIKMHVWGYPVISPMGKSLSIGQIDRLKRSNIKTVCLLFDGDDPGRAAVTKVGRQLLEADLEVEAPVVSEGFKPHRLDPAELKIILKT